MVMHVKYTERLDKALRKAAWAHDKQGQYRKHSDVPYIIHPVGVMLIATLATTDENTLIACLLHDVLEDVDATYYDANSMEADFGADVVQIVQDVSKDDSIADWKARNQAYLHHMEKDAREESVIVCAADKIHNLRSTLYDYDSDGEKLWERFTTKKSSDQLWWYESVLETIKSRNAPGVLIDALSAEINKLKQIL